MMDGIAGATILISRSKQCRVIVGLKAKESQRQIVVLVPASVGSNWWKEHVHREAWVLFLNRRITFEGHTAGYPKDLALIVYGPDKAGCGYDIWDWRTANEVLG
jgi:hypothetical protein